MGWPRAASTSPSRRARSQTWKRSTPAWAISSWRRTAPASRLSERGGRRPAAGRRSARRFKSRSALDEGGEVAGADLAQHAGELLPGAAGEVVDQVRAADGRAGGGDQAARRRPWGTVSARRFWIRRRRRVERGGAGRVALEARRRSAASPGGGSPPARASPARVAIHSVLPPPMSTMAAVPGPRSTTSRTAR